MKMLALAAAVALLSACNLFFPTQVSFQNSSSVTFSDVRIGPVDYALTLAPGQSTGFFSIPAGTYTLDATGGPSGTWTQTIVNGYSYTLIFFLNGSVLDYSAYVSMAR